MYASRSGSIPGKSNALACSSIGSEASRNRLSGLPGREAWFSVSVQRSASSGGSGGKPLRFRALDERRGG